MYRFVSLVIALLASEYVSLSLTMPSMETLEPMESVLPIENDVKEASNPVDDVEKETEYDIQEMAETLKRTTMSQYEQGMKELKKWANYELLAPHLENAQAGLTIAKDRLIEIADKASGTILNSITEAKNTMEPEQFLEYLAERPQILEIDTKPAYQYFADGMKAITDIGTNLDNIPSEVSHQVDNTADQLQQTGLGVVDNAIQTGQNTADQLKKIGGSVSTRLQQTGNTVANQLHKGLSSVKSMFESGIRGATDSISSLPNVTKSVSV